MLDTEIVRYEAIFCKLRSKCPEERACAERQIAAFSSDDVQPIIKVFQRRKKLLLVRVFLSCVLFFVFVFCFQAILESRSYELSGCVVSAFVLICGGNILSAVRTNRADDLVHVLTKFSHVSVLPALIEAREYSTFSSRPIILTTITRLLLQLKPADADLLKRRHKQYFNSVLLQNSHASSSELAIAILKAYEQIGGPAELSTVQQVADGKCSMAQFPRVHEAAQACLPFLIERTDGKKSSQTLLRATGEPTSNAPAILLRPAHGGEKPEVAQQLLRPGRVKEDMPGE